MEIRQTGFIDETGFYTAEAWAAKQRDQKMIDMLTEIRDLLKIIAAPVHRSEDRRDPRLG